MASSPSSPSSHHHHVCVQVCRIPNLNVVGIRRKRLKGDAWCYKKVGDGDVHDEDPDDVHDDVPDDAPDYVPDGVPDDIPFDIADDVPVDDTAP